MFRLVYVTQVVLGVTESVHDLSEWLRAYEQNMHVC